MSKSATVCMGYIYSWFHFQYLKLKIPLRNYFLMFTIYDVNCVVDEDTFIAFRHCLDSVSDGDLLY